MRTPSTKTKSSLPLKPLISATTNLWRQYHLTYDQARYVTKEMRKALGMKRVKVRKRVIQCLSRDEEQRLIQQAYRDKGERGLLIKTLFQTGARVAEFVNIKVEDFFFEEAMILIGLTAALEYYQRGNVDIHAALILAITMFFGAWVGAYLANKMAGLQLRLTFGIFVLGLGVYLIYGACKRLGWI